MWDNFGCINFAGGEVGHLIAFGKASLQNRREKNHTVLASCVFSLGGKSKNDHRFYACLRYLSQNFPTAVALPRDRIGDYPGHL